ncbi:MAG: prepilin-type N-terminal cleavage/methylation domain-containing protein [Ghiorsea sp.]
MSNLKNKEKGFSLVELIGVLAIIAILASLVAPRVFTAIEDAKISALIQDVQRLRTVATQYYKDTGLQAQQEPGGAATSRTLISNGATAKGWKGPYIEEELSSPFDTSTKYVMLSGANAFDVDGDGTGDFSKSTILYVDGLSFDQAKAVSEAIDQDSDKTGNSAWYKGGKVRTRNSNAPSQTALGSSAAGSDLFIMLSGY